MSMDVIELFPDLRDPERSTFSQDKWMNMPKNQYTTSLAAVIEAQECLKVDEYQRTYQWGKEQIEDLFSDLDDTLSEGDTHFFGTLILQQHDSETMTVVDGQQRLTTIFMILATLRDEVVRLDNHSLTPSNPDEMSVNVLESIRRFLYYSNSYSSARLAPNRFIRELFKKCVMAQGESQILVPTRDRRSTLAFRKAIKQIREEVAKLLEDYDGEERLRQIHKILNTIVEKFLVLRVVTSSLTESLEIFLTLNNRGQPLGPSDIVRGEVLSARGLSLTEDEQRTLQEIVNTEWEDVVERVEDPEIFLRHYLVYRTAEKTQKKMVVKTVQGIISGEDKEIKRKAATEFWFDLQDASEVYAQIIKPTMGGSRQSNLELVNPLSKSQRILLLAAFRHVSDEKSLDEITRLTTVLAFRWVVAGGNAQRLEDYFQELCKEKEKEEFGALLLNSLKRKIEGLKPNTLDYLSTGADSTYVTRALLYRINEVLADGSQPLAKSPREINLEHIAPRTKTDQWLDALRVDGNEDEYARVASGAGNLTLLDTKLNIKTSQKPFHKKLGEEYSKSVVFITRDLKEQPEWDASAIDQRTKWLAEMFEKIWATTALKKSDIEPFSTWSTRNQKS